MGGRKEGYRGRWLVWGALSLAYVIGIFHRMSMGAVRTELEAAFGLSATAFAALGSAFLVVYMVMQIPAGILVDTWGLRRTATAGAATAGLGSILFGLAPSAAWVLAARLVVGLGASVLFVSILKAISVWFGEREFGTITGLTGVLASVGGMVAQAPLVLLVAWAGWRGSFGIVGALGLASAALCFALARDRPQEGQPIAAPRMRAAGEAKRGGGGAGFVAVARVCANPRTWPPALVYAGCYGAFITLTGTWGQSYLHCAYGMDAVRAADLVTLALVGFAIANFGLGWVSDRIGKRKSPILALAVANFVFWGIFVLGYRCRPPATLLGPILFAVGFSSAAYTTSWACAKEANPPSFAGTSTAVVNSVGILGAIVLPIAFGAVLDGAGGGRADADAYSKAFIVCLAAVGVGCAASAFIKETGCANAWGPGAEKRGDP